MMRGRLSTMMSPEDQVNTITIKIYSNQTIDKTIGVAHPIKDMAPLSFAFLGCESVQKKKKKKPIIGTQKQTIA